MTPLITVSEQFGPNGLWKRKIGNGPWEDVRSPDRHGRVPVTFMKKERIKVMMKFKVVVIEVVGGHGRLTLEGEKFAPELYANQLYLWVPVASLCQYRFGQEFLLAEIPDPPSLPASPPVRWEENAGVEETPTSTPPTVNNPAGSDEDLPF